MEITHDMSIHFFKFHNKILHVHAYILCIILKKVIIIMTVLSVIQLITVTTSISSMPVCE